MFILIKWSDINKTNLNQFRFLNTPVAKILAIYIGDNKDKKADSDIAHSFEAKLLLARSIYIMLIINL